MPSIKFCGVTRPADARHAADLGASYVGVVFAGGPRNLTPDAARAVFDAAGAGDGAPRRVGVFGDADPEEIARVAREAGLDAVQLHADPDLNTIREVRRRFDGEIWAVVRVEDDLPAGAQEVFDAADAVVLDRRSSGSLGGTGENFAWNRIAKPLREIPRRARLVVAGGLSPENVAEAVRLLSPDVVDVSSGVESEPGVKDHSRMRDFVRAVRGDSE